MASIPWRSFVFAGLAFASFPAWTSAGGPPPTVKIETSKTSIYVGNVTLSTTPLRWEDGVYSADYRAKVFPYFFSNEKGHLTISFSAADVARLDRGEVVYFKGEAQNTDHEKRRIEGRAVPADAKHGKIKVRVFVTPKIELIFNSLYQFEEAERKAEG
jgi:hypothetical protein